MKVQQQKCDMKTYKVDIARTKTNPGVGLPYSIVAQIVPVDETSTRLMQIHVRFKCRYSKTV